MRILIVEDDAAMARGLAERLKLSGFAVDIESDGASAAQTALLDAEFRAFDGLDDDDAMMLGFELDSVEPPEAESDQELLPLMTERLLRGHA